MLDSLRIKNFRCFEDLEIKSLGRVNLIVGKNNVGKTTLLEAIYALAFNGNEKFFKHILETRNEFFNEGDFVSKIKYSSKTSNIFIGDKNLNIDHTYPAIDWSHTIGRLDPDDIKPFSNVETQLESESNLARAWDQAYLHSEEERITEALRILDDRITNIVFVQSPKAKEERVAIIKIKNQPEAIPLKALGEGMSRLLNIFLKSISAKNGFLTIDEFENGLHYSIQEEVWQRLFILAKELDIQVFATTHSMDTVKSFSKVTLESPEEGRLISLGRIQREVDKGKIKAITYDEKEIEVIARTGIEVR